MARITTSTNTNVLQDVFLAKRFVEALRQNLVAARFGTQEAVPESSGKTVRWNFFANPTAATTPLSEGSDPTSPTSLSTTSITATLSEYGAYIETSKIFNRTSTSGTMAEIVDAAAYQAALTIDTLCYSQSLNDTTNTGTSIAGMTAEEVRAKVQKLHENNAKPHPSTPGGRYYAALMHPEQLFDMMGEATSFAGSQSPTWWMAKQTDSGMPGAIGIPGQGEANMSLYGAYIYETTNVSTTTASHHDAYFIAKDGFGAISLDGGFLNPRVIITSPEERVDKPLRNSGTVGWWVSFATELIDSNRVVESLTTNSA